MAKSKNKTVANNNSVAEFIQQIIDTKKQQQTKDIVSMMQECTGEEPVMWGTSIIGFGTYHYRYDSGREGDFMKAGFSPRKSNFSLYIMSGMKRFPELMDKLGKYKTGKSCLYIKDIGDVDTEILKKLIKESYNYMTKKYG